MTEQIERFRHAVERGRSHLARRRADERGLTTLEWLLIVAAVAGLAALAVVLVQNVVDDTSEQISGSSARVTAARVAAEAIVSDADRNEADHPSEIDSWDQWISFYTAKCNRLSITYGDAGIDVVPNFASAGFAWEKNGTGAASSIYAAGPNDTLDSAPWTKTAPPGEAMAQCVVVG